MIASGLRKLIVINGATRGLGHVIVQQLINLPNVEIVCLVRNIENLGKLIEIVEKKNFYQIDLNQTLELSGFENYLSEKINRGFDEFYFINNVSTIHPIGKIGSLSTQDIINSISINVTSNFLIINSILKVVKGVTNIKILNISSGIAINPLPGASLYGIGKCYLDYLTQLLNIERSGLDLQVSSFYPGSMTTDMRSTFLYELNSNIDLSEFDYSHLENQTLSEPSTIAHLIIKHFIVGKSGWTKRISKFYDYE